MAVVVLDDKRLKNMMNDPQFASTFPCLDTGRKLMQTRLTKCPRCKTARGRARKRTLSQVRNCIASLDGKERGKLKRMMGNNPIRVIARRGNKNVRLTF